jgi:hypothetical protein
MECRRIRSHSGLMMLTVILEQRMTRRSRTARGITQLTQNIMGLLKGLIRSIIRIIGINI